MTRKILLWVFGLGGSFLLSLLILLLNDIGGSYRNFYKEMFAWTAPIFCFFPIAFIFSLVTFKLKDEVFLLWFRFSRWWIPLSILLYFVTPHNVSTGFLSFDIGGMILMFLLGVYTFVSAFLIIVKSIGVYKKNPKTSLKK